MECIGITFVIVCLVVRAAVTNAQKAKTSQPNVPVKPAEKQKKHEEIWEQLSDEQYQQTTTEDTWEKSPAVRAYEAKKSGEILERANRNIARQQQAKQDTPQAKVDSKRDKIQEYKNAMDAVNAPKEHALIQREIEHRKDMETGLTGDYDGDVAKEIADIMVKGYSGDLDFDRDFISEGMDMLNRIQTL